MSNYHKHYLKQALEPATQREPLPGQIANSAGGFSFALDDWKRLERFLILGSEGGSYYATERKLTRDNAAAVTRCIAADGPRTVAKIVEISHAGRAPKNDPAILALAMASKLGDDATRAAAYAALPQVCRTGTHLYHFVAFATELGGWGRGMKRAVGDWFNKRPADDAAYQLVKYQSRDGWSARDLLRLSHPEPASPEHDTLYAWATTGYGSCGDKPGDLPGIVKSFEMLKDIAAGESVTATDVAYVVKQITDHRLPREAVPTTLLTKPETWEALLPHMGLTAMIRNLATMTRLGLLAPFSDSLKAVTAQLGDATALKKALVHPIAILSALRTYSAGHGVKSAHTWTPQPQIVDALDSAFYLAFGSVVPTGKNTLLALDVSGSMSQGEIAGVPGLTPREASAAMALVTAATEPNYHVVGFSTRLIDLPITPRMRLADAVRAVSGLPFEATNCSQPMIWASEHGGKVDSFAVYTDSETYAGRVHPSVALSLYRTATGRAAKLAVVGMLANPFTIADPNDAGMLDVVGFDTATPAVMADFFRDPE